MILVSVTLWSITVKRLAEKHSDWSNHSHSPRRALPTFEKLCRRLPLLGCTLQHLASVLLDALQRFVRQSLLAHNSLVPLLNLGLKL